MRHRARHEPNAHPRGRPFRPESVPILDWDDDAANLPDQPLAKALDADLRHRLVSEAAFRRFAERGYTEGGEMDDWRDAEADIEHLLVNPRATEAGEH